MSSYLGSSSGNNFYATSMIPCTTEATPEANGKCMVNVDGRCIRGGVKVAGSSGYELASMGYPTNKCNSLGLFAGGNKRYTQFGWEVNPNANVLKLSRPML